ncbi:hypothetical protein TWF225_009975 [Orbilia oligospora]|nr:hypothetical protein TWF225_009975 [Orbilia oligospora]KAF3243930.1 hypothetical protein TWF128_009867 [Orbilia oligospora]KAF3245870.1 hypothetical protein TWF217_010052 [Orbilia oligospora]KAF3283916.1 hypothetical protein TWF132_009930 [Orbilia oligospora]
MTCGIVNGGTLKYPGNLGVSASNCEFLSLCIQAKLLYRLLDISAGFPIKPVIKLLTCIRWPLFARLSAHPRNIDRNLPGPDQPHQNSYSPTPTAPPPPTTPGGPDSGLDQDSATLNNPSLL